MIDDTLQVLDSGISDLLILLDFSATFDKVNHAILLETLKSRMGINGTVLKWFETFLQDRSQRVKLDDYLSAPKPATHGEPQGSILTTTLFNLYIEPLGALL